ncbi:MAG: hypothetical protein H7A36_04535 [Chlamydiales bacterium]|nr:hypothetical protein [Chlamydiales bacterium]
MKIAILVGDNPYGTTPIFAKGLAKALRRLDVDVDLHYVGDGHFFHAFYDMLADPPDLTFSFSDIRGLNWGIPHFTFALDPVYFYRHQKGILTCVDEEDAKRAGIPFLPHAYDPMEVEEKERIYDTVFFGSCFELDFPAHIVKKGERVLHGELAEWDDDFLLVDRYVRAVDRIKLCEQFENLTIWGDGTWKKYIPHAKILPPIPFEETLKVMSEAKCVLNSSPRIRNGLHERILYAAHLGCRVVTAENAWTTGFPQGEWEKAKECSSQVKGEHTWDVRAKQIMEVINGITSRG